MAIQRTEVDGVPTLLAPSAGVMHAGLVFRVGRADETLARSGITHLLEHLTLFALGPTDYHYNASTASVVTSFHTAGSEEDIIRFLNAVCDGLANTPFERLETERAIVRTEWSGRKSSVAESLALWRYGARGYGLVGYHEPGVHAISAQELRAWSQQYFTRQNAVLWIAGDAVPQGLSLRLPDGQRRAVPVPTSALPTTPAYYGEGRDGVAFDAIVRRSAAAAVFSEVFERSLFRNLRQEAGISYTAEARFDPRGDEFGTVIAAVDALPERLDAAVGGFIDTLAALRVGRIDRSDVDSYLAKAEDAVRHPDAEAATLTSAAFELLTGRPIRSLAERVTELRAVTVDDVHAMAQEVMSTALLRVPQGNRADWAGFTAAPTHSESTVPGQHYRSRLGPDINLIVGAEGVTSVNAGVRTTVRFDQCAALLAWPDGGRVLIGEDGFTVSVEPTLYAITPSVLAQIDAGPDPQRRVTMPVRDPQSIPQPPPQTAQAEQATTRGRRVPRQRVVWPWVFFIVALLCARVVTNSLRDSRPDSSSTEPTDWPLTIGLIAVLVGVAGLGTWLLIWVRRRRS